MEKLKKLPILKEAKATPANILTIPDKVIPGNISD